MKDAKSSENKDILEKYALGIASQEEMNQVDQLIGESEEAKAELNEIQEALELYAFAHKKSPRSGLRKQILEAVLSEEDSLPDIGSETSTEDWDRHIIRHSPPEAYENIFSIKLEKTKKRTTMLVWIKKDLPEEIHESYVESFFVLSGTCTCYFEGKVVKKMVPGDHMEIPLHIPHSITVSSKEPLKLIVQRKAA